MPDSRRQDEDVLAYFESQAICLQQAGEEGGVRQTSQHIVVTIFKFRLGFNEVN